jgi:prepilin-type N-terminal cleavage/methylation domain-containing protein
MKKNIPDTKYQIQNTNNAFTLIEILVAIGIVSILAAVVLVSMKSFGARGRSAKALGQLSSVIPSMVSCWGNGKTVKNPTDGGGAICRESGVGGADVTSYGYYPDLSTGDLSSYSYGQIDMGKGSWHFGIQSPSDDKAICCNMTLNACKEVTRPLASSNCNDSAPSN